MDNDWIGLDWIFFFHSRAIYKMIDHFILKFSFWFVHSHWHMYNLWKFLSGQTFTTIATTTTTSAIHYKLEISDSIKSSLKTFCFWRKKKVRPIDRKRTCVSRHLSIFFLFAPKISTIVETSDHNRNWSCVPKTIDDNNIRHLWVCVCVCVYFHTHHHLPDYHYCFSEFVSLMMMRSNWMSGGRKKTAH